jgi:organic hydroperoxide reductase OsmC/OhrA
MKTHHYQINLQWTGNEGTGTSDYRSYKRDHLLSGLGKMLEIPGSSDPSFRGDPGRYNPEELLVASLSACHMLWFLHLCAVNKIVVIDYQDEATGIMEETEDGGGRFREVTLHPVVTVAEQEMAARTEALHHEAHRLCFIANSCNFPVKHQAEVRY